MPMFMDVHRNMKGITPEQLVAAHQADLDIESEEKVHFHHAWADPESGYVFCLSEGPTREAVMRIHERSGNATNEVYPVPIEV